MCSAGWERIARPRLSYSAIDWHTDGGSIETMLGGPAPPHRRVEAEASCQQGKRARLHPGDLLSPQDILASRDELRRDVCVLRRALLHTQASLGGRLLEQDAPGWQLLLPELRLRRQRLW